MEAVKLKWHIKNHTSFYAEHEGYVIYVTYGNWWFWEIMKSGNIVETAYRHPPTYDELSAKIQAEKCLNKIFISIQL